MLETKHTLRILPVHVINPQANKERSVHVAEELESLITTLGGEIVDRLIQKLDKPDHNTFIGRGKVQELLVKVKEHEVDVVVLNTMAKPGQVHALKLAVEKVNPQIEVWDRIDLILHIFEKHADTTEAKLQIELARMKYMGPRIYGMGFVLSRQGGGIGTIGKGETNTELMQRHWRDQVKKVKDQLEKITQAREQQLERRKRVGFKTVSLVGYTNAGKSSLYNLLSKKDKLVENALFATLDSSVGKLYLPGFAHEVLVTDTIGFIRNLPPHLIDAFKSTLLESIHADVILHVVDLSDPEVDTKIKVVNKILYELGRDPDDVLFVFNKTDAATEEQKHYVFTRFAHLDPLFISVKKNEGIEQLQERIAARLQEHPLIEESPAE